MIKSRRMSWAEHVERIAEMRNGNVKGHSGNYAQMEDNIKMDFRGTDLEGLDWVHLTYNRGGCREQSKEPSGSIRNRKFHF
jgi:hypothetical protein